MNSLRTRVVALAVLVAVLSATLCAFAARRSTAAALTEQEDRFAQEALALGETAIAVSRRQLAELAAAYARIAAQVDAQGVVPPHDAQRLRLAILTQDRVVGDPLPVDEERARRLASPGGDGLLITGDAVWVHAAARVDAERILFALSQPPPSEAFGGAGWTAALKPSTPLRASEVDADSVQASLALPADGGSAVLAVAIDRSLARLAWTRAQAAVLAAGLAAAAVAIIIGSALGWSWLRPIIALAAACRERATGRDAPLPQVGGLPEAMILREALDSLLEGERTARDRLAQTLEREAAVNAVHQRFLAQLAHEFAQPIRALTGTIELLRSQGGRLEPERLAEAHDTALKLEERFQEVLGLAADLVDRAAPQPRIAAARYLADLAAILRPQADRLGVTLQVEAPEDVVEVDARLLSPILVNLAANGMRAAASASGERRLALRARLDTGGSRWTVEDGGAGIPEPLAGRIAAACARGEVLPAEPGMGLGLALALANARALGGRLALTRNGPGGASFELALPPSSAARPSTA